MKAKARKGGEYPGPRLKKVAKKKVVKKAAKKAKRR